MDQGDIIGILNIRDTVLNPLNIHRALTSDELRQIADYIDNPSGSGKSKNPDDFMEIIPSPVSVMNNEWYEHSFHSDWGGEGVECSLNYNDEYGVLIGNYEAENKFEWIVYASDGDNTVDVAHGCSETLIKAKDESLRYLNNFKVNK